MLGALMVQGVTPGPTTFMSNPQLIWGLVASMWVGNLFLLVLNLPLVGLWARLALTPYRWLLPIIVLCSCVGVYSVNNSLSTSMPPQHLASRICVLEDKMRRDADGHGIRSRCSA